MFIPSVPAGVWSYWHIARIIREYFDPFIRTDSTGTYESITVMIEPQVYPTTQPWYTVKWSRDGAGGWFGLWFLE